MKPYSVRGMSDEQRIFNYRLSRARRVVENAFGVLAHRWRCLLTTLQLEPRKVIEIVNASMVLHNLLQRKFPGIRATGLESEDDNSNVVPGDWVFS